MVRGVLMAEFREIEVFDLITLSTTVNAWAVFANISWPIYCTHTSDELHSCVAFFLIVNNMQNCNDKFFMTLGRELE